MDIEEDLAMLFDNDNFSNIGLDEEEDDEEVGGSSTAAAEGHYLTLLALGVPMTSSMIEDLCTHVGNMKYDHGVLVKKVMTVSDIEVADSIAIEEIHLRVYAVEGQVQVMTSLIVQATLQAVVQLRNMQIQHLQTLVAKMSSREGTLMQCILGLDRRLTDMERRPSGPQWSCWLFALILLDYDHFV
uniref:Uncharacterized protein n=1 Tax=Tanacetum cinerariifolium TaxID=118510 RepID=A0A6L2NF52_TANCI|nr:hypothetical protein [Tanacetum cinerariifolium]